MKSKQQAVPCEDLKDLITKKTVKNTVKNVDKNTSTTIETILDGFKTLNLNNESLIARGRESRGKRIHENRALSSPLHRDIDKNQQKNENYNISSCNTDDLNHVIKCDDCLTMLYKQSDFELFITRLCGDDENKAAQNELNNEDKPKVAEKNISNFTDIVKSSKIEFRRESQESSDSGYLTSSPQMFPEKESFSEKIDDLVAIREWVKIYDEKINMFELDYNGRTRLERLLDSPDERESPHFFESFYVFMEYMREKGKEKNAIILSKRKNLIKCIQKHPRCESLLPYFLETIQFVETNLRSVQKNT